MVRLHPHAQDRLLERGASKEEVVATVEGGESFPAKYGRTGFRRNFSLTVFGVENIMLQNRLRHMQLKRIKIGLLLQ